MPSPTVGLLHPGEMGAAIGAVLTRRGVAVVWASAGRSADTAGRARAAGLRDVRTVEELTRTSDVVLSVCPPHAALDVARGLGSFDGVYVDANDVSPATALAVAATVESAGATYVDGGIVGGPPSDARETRLYLSGSSAAAVAGLFERTTVAARTISERPGAASALKMAYAGWSKGSAALLLALRAAARAEHVEDALLAEWELSLPELPAESLRAASAASQKGWRWVGEMEEVAATFASAGLPDGFHRAAADVFRRVPRRAGHDPADALQYALSGLARSPRVLSWDGCLNVRDLGGHRTDDGRETRVRDASGEIVGMGIP